MILSDLEIQDALSKGQITIDPEPREQQYTTSAVDLILGDEILVLRSIEELEKEEPAGVYRPIIVDAQEVDAKSLFAKYAKKYNREGDGSFHLKPGEFYLGITRERLVLPRESKIAARVEGRSTLARLGLVVHLTAPTIHAGFPGKIALEMYNFGPYTIRVVPGVTHICQIIFERLGEVPKGPVRTRFKDQNGLS